MARPGKRAIASVMPETPAGRCMENPSVRLKETTV
jgi:hypothetical protein